MSADFDPRKLRELVLFIAEESEHDPRFGATKLNKILYFADFKAFGIHGRSITGAAYQRLDRGPAPVQLLPLLDQMEREGEIERTERWYYNRLQKVIHARRAPDVDRVLDADELRIVRMVLRDLKHLDASQVSALSHLEAGWQLARDREVIPYETVYLSDRRPTPRERAIWEQDVDRRRSHRAGS